MAKSTIKDSYRDFDVISIREVPDCSSVAVYLRHRQTGLEIFHLLNDDEENLFAFAFRTPIKDSTGAAHILEHSVFCGSEKFPLKEPFTNMMNQSVNTFLNALTYSDKTVYPASSMNRADYFNLMDVYGDAVFFPLLKKEAFLQEAYRLELDDGEGDSIQGVVYNEMKGAYSSFESVANDEQLRSLFAGSNYAYDSGGDPLEIPTFTYEAFKAFHKKYYRPDNCLIFMYGNIPTEEQIDFLYEKLLFRLSVKFPILAESHEAYPFVPEEFVQIETPDSIAEPVHVSAPAPHTGATGNTVTLNWLCGSSSDLNSYVECAFLAEVLSGHDGSPLTKVLIESELGDDLAPITGAMNEMRSFLMAFGLHGVKKGDEEKVYKIIEDTLLDLYKNGIDQAHIDAALMSAEFSNREVVRSGGPYSLVLLDRVLCGWNYGSSPAEMLLFRDAIENIRKRCESDSAYVQNLILKYLLNNTSRSYVSVFPSKKYLSERAEKEKVLVSKLRASLDAGKVKADLELLHSYQQYHETKEDTACIPRLNLSDLKSDVERIETQVFLVSAGSEQVSLFSNREATNGIVYFSVCFPVDVLDPEDYKYLPLYSYCATNVGWNGKDWAQCAEETGVKTGGIYTRLLSSEGSRTEDAELLRKKLAPHNCTDRDWIVFTVRFINEKTDEALALFSESLSSFHFNDTKRLKTLTGEAVSSIKSSVVPKGNRYALKRVQCTKNHACAADEIWNGFSQVFSLVAISKQNVKGLASRFESLTERLFSAGAILHVTADDEGIGLLQEKLPEFIRKTNIHPLQPKKPADEPAFLKMLLLPGEKNLPAEEFFEIDSQVGFAAKSYESSYFGTPESSAELVLAHWLSGNYLWERLRTTGGAYGAYAGAAGMRGLFNFSSFRDPTPVKSPAVFRECLEDFAELLIDRDECERNITGTYGDEVQPHSPSGRGVAGFFRTLYCISDEDRRRKITGLLSVTPEQLRDCAKRLLSGEEKSHTAVVCDKNTKKTGVIIKLPLQ